MRRALQILTMSSSGFLAMFEGNMQSKSKAKSWLMFFPRSILYEDSRSVASQARSRTEQESSSILE